MFYQKLKFHVNPWIDVFYRRSEFSKIEKTTNLTLFLNRQLFCSSQSFSFRHTLDFCDTERLSIVFCIFNIYLMKIPSMCIHKQKKKPEKVLRILRTTQFSNFKLTYSLFCFPDTFLDDMKGKQHSVTF